MAMKALAVRPSHLFAGAVLLVCLPAGGGRVTVADAAAGVAVLAAFGPALRERTGPRAGILLPFGAVVLSVAVAAVLAADPTAGIVGFIRYTEIFVLIPVGVAVALRGPRDVFVVAGALVAATVLEGIVGVWQTATDTGASYAGRYVRAVGTFGAEQIMALGAVTGYGILVALALALALRGRARIALLATAALLTVPLACSLSRGAWIATAVAVAVQLLVHSWRLGVAAVAVAAFAAGLLLSGVGPAALTVDERVASIASAGSAPDRSVRDRYALWDTAIAIWADHPVAGVGLKDFAEERDSYAPMSLSAGSDVDDPGAGFRREPLLSAHNQYLMILAEQGAVGVVAFGWLLGALAAGALRRRGCGFAVLDVLAPGVLAWTLLDFTYGDIGAGPTGVLLAVLLGLVARRAMPPEATP
jgi:hypothetical protein